MQKIIDKMGLLVFETWNQKKTLDEQASQWCLQELK